MLIHHQFGKKSMNKMLISCDQDAKYLTFALVLSQRTVQCCHESFLYHFFLQSLCTLDCLNGKQVLMKHSGRTKIH